jgi:hypothetical protein
MDIGEEDRRGSRVWRTTAPAAASRAGVIV